jgi:hypothetical protein
MTALRRLFPLLAFAAAAFVATAATAPAPLELRPFGARSLAAIKQAHAGRPFILALWSVTCEPCREETMLLAEVHRKHPHLPIILVAADPPEMRPQVLRFLAHYRLGRIALWQFEDDSPERLRYSVDRSWTGELPRTYFFDTAHEPVAHSGVVDERWLAEWLERHAPAAAPRK